MLVVVGRYPRVASPAPLERGCDMTTIRNAAHEGLMVATLAGGLVLGMMFAKGMAGAVIYLGELALR